MGETLSSSVTLLIAWEEKERRKDAELILILLLLLLTLRTGPMEWQKGRKKATSERRRRRTTTKKWCGCSRVLLPAQCDWVLILGSFFPSPSQGRLGIERIINVNKGHRLEWLRNSANGLPFGRLCWWDWDEDVAIVDSEGRTIFDDDSSETGW